MTLAAKRFWDKIHKTASCWIWIGAKNHAGYGKFYRSKDQRQQDAHRFSWELYFGSIPDGMFVCHRCSNPSCIHPDHLFLSDHQGNMNDMMIDKPVDRTILKQKRFYPLKGEDRYNAKLTNHDAMNIRILDIPMRKLAALYNVAYSVIWKIKRGKTHYQ